jgi:hypothetical protein
LSLSGGVAWRLQRVDMWSMGVITFALLGGYLPFFDDNEVGHRPPIEGMGRRDCIEVQQHRWPDLIDVNLISWEGAILVLGVLSCFVPWCRVLWPPVIPVVTCRRVSACVGAMQVRRARKAIRGEYRFHESKWAHVSDEAKVRRRGNTPNTNRSLD